MSENQKHRRDMTRRRALVAGGGVVVAAGIGVGVVSIVTATFGKTVTLPEPVGMELDTEPLKDWVQ
ncbi:hypothetical protein ACGFZH_19560 [Streptomyces zaomyceticus]|uniref:hypothetical protein n=1 Tax=Streptomyces zaomyceticus TaxID=68286 RepID=UPI00371A8F94